MGIIINNLIFKVMVIGKIKPTATLVAQFAAGVEVEAIQHEGKMFLPVVGMGEFAPAEDAPEKPAAASPKKKEPAPAEDAPATSYTKEELMEMDTKEMVKILKNDFGINPDDFDGTNTNKKLRDLILNAQKDGGAKPEPEAEEDDAPAPKKGKKAPAKEEPANEDDEELINSVGDILEDFDGGKKNKKKTIAAICELSDDADSDKVAELVAAFEDDGDADIDEVAKEIAAVLKGEEKPKKETKKSAPKKGKKENLIEPEDLEVGDKVSVWWDDDNQEWYDGEVKSIKKGKILIAYEDGSEDVLDSEIHTKIKRLAE